MIHGLQQQDYSTMRTNLITPGERGRKGRQGVVHTVYLDNTPRVCP